MVITVDHKANIDRIIEILEADKDIFDKANPLGKLRKILFAISEEGILDDSTPYAWVGVANKFQSTREGTGTALAGFIPNMVEYHIGIVSQRKGAATTQEELLKFTKLIIEAISNNPRLTKPSDSSDPKVARSIILRTERYFPKTGRTLDANRIVIACQVGTLWQLELPSLSLTLDLISRPIDEDNISADVDLEDDSTISVTKIADPGSLDVEFQADEPTEATLRTAISAADELTMNIKKDGVTSRTVVGVLTSIRQPVPNETVEKSVLSMTLIS